MSILDKYIDYRNYHAHQHFKSLPNRRSRLEWLIGGRVKAHKLSTIINNNFVDYFLPKIRGMLFSCNFGKFTTPEEAIQSGKEIKQRWKIKLGKMGNE